MVVNDNNIIVYYNLPIPVHRANPFDSVVQFDPPPTFKYVPTTIMLTIEVGIVVRPSE